MPTFAEFFAGIGLVRMGLERQGWNISFANDISEKKYEMYNAQFPDAIQHFLLQDIHYITPEQIPTVDLATASFPCTDLSIAGRRDGLDGVNSRTFWNFIHILEGMGTRRPPLVMLENVIGLLKSNKGRDFETALLALNNLGYTVDAFVVDAAYFVPQSRPRLFVIGNMSTSHVSEDRLQITDTRPKDLIAFMRKYQNIQWHIEQLPPFPIRKKTLATLLEDLPDDHLEWWSSDRAEYLLRQMSKRHTLIAEHMINGDTWSYGTVFRRMRGGKSTAELRVDGIAGCLRTPKGGSAKQIVFKAGHGEYYARLLTPVECARLMGAENYRITVSHDQALFGFGDAVCVPVIEWIAQNYLSKFLRKEELFQPLAV